MADRAPDFRVDSGDLPLFCPTGESDPGLPEARLVHVIIYTKRRTPPIQAIFWVPRPTSFKLEEYTLPFDTGTSILNASSKYEVYSVISGNYTPAWIPVNLVGRGNFLILRRCGIPEELCPERLAWERRANASAEYDPRGNTLPPSSPPRPSSPLPDASNDALAMPAAAEQPIELADPRARVASNSMHEETAPAKKKRKRSSSVEIVGFKIHALGTSKNPFVIPGL